VRAGVFSKALRTRIVLLYAGLTAANIGAWIWALLAFGSHPALLATCFVAYGFGLRHAVDADHIAAIDNVTRKLMQAGQRPAGVGLFFSLGHATVVILTCVAIALSATALQSRFETFKLVGGIFGTLVSGLFLLAIAAMNSAICVELWARFRALRAGQPKQAEMVLGGGLLSRLFRPFFGLITQSWHMYPLGFLFGLGFDTATEIGLLGLSAAGATKGMTIWSILVFPALFTAAMSLVDATDGVLMLGAYGWAFIQPLRKIYYNLTITLLSILVAVMIGGIEILGVMGDQFSLGGPFWRGVAWLGDNSNGVGFFVIFLFMAGWVISMAVYRLRGYDRLESTV